LDDGAVPLLRGGIESLGESSQHGPGHCLRRRVSEPMTRADDDEGVDAFPRLRDPDIAFAVSRGDEARRSRAVAELGPESVHEKVDVAVRDVGARMRDRVEDVAPAQEAVRALHEELEE